MILTKLSETATTITLGWSPVPGCIGYRMTAEKQAKPSHSWNPQLSSTRFSKGSAWYKVEALGVADSDTYPDATTPPPAGSYPASYYNGPLGDRNILPPKGKAFLITWPIGTATVDYWPQQQQKIIAREAAMGRKYDGIMTAYTQAEGEWAENRLAWVQGRGCIPIVAGFHFGSLTVTQIANGQADAEIDRRADHYKALGFTLMIRMMHEFDLPHLAYTSKGREADYVRAWRRVVDRFKAKGVTNVGWWWCPMEGYDRASAAASYPGDTYVDWVGTDPYNYSYVGESGWSSPMHAGWATFAEVANYPKGWEYDYPDPAMDDKQNYRDTYGPRKPFVIGETATTYDSNHPAHKAAWYRDIPATVREMEYLCGISFFDQDVSVFEGPKTNWLVAHPSSRPEMLAAFVAMAQDPVFNSR